MVSYIQAEQDFLYSVPNNNTKPSEEICTALMKHKRFENTVVQANSEGVSSVSFCAEGDGQMSIVYDPVYVSSVATKLLVTFEDDQQMQVWFDRN